VIDDPKPLLTDLKRQVRSLEYDLRRRAEDEAESAFRLHTEWERARSADRTTSSYDAWCDDWVTQVAVAWVLATVFIRFCEDNDLIELPVIAGPDERLAIALERQKEFFIIYPEKTDRDWIIEGVKALSVSRVAAELFDETHNPMWTILPSNDAAKELLTFWRWRAESGKLAYDFANSQYADDYSATGFLGDVYTRFLGDIYQGLSEHARDNYSLIQTPNFVVEFILDRTLNPALDEFGLTPKPPLAHQGLAHSFRFIDPACGSGHFLLGAFRRLLKAWEDQTGGTDGWVLIRRALESVHGVDKNPFAVAIARFRLMLAAMRAAKVKRLTEVPDFTLNVAVGDSLRHGYGASGTQGTLYDLPELSHTYYTEDIEGYIKSVHILAFGSYHAVATNPPYKIVRDKAENSIYRCRYVSCHREYPLSVPFAECIFKLAVHGSLEGAGAGYVGQILANSFMKREFGKRLIEEFFPKVHLTHVIDTSGAYIPGHGTPTVILLGRRRYPRNGSTTRAVLGVRGEPRQPSDPAKGLVWQAIINQVDRPGSGSEWVSVVDLEGGHLAKHPWSLSGGGAVDLRVAIEIAHSTKLRDRIVVIGFSAISGEDDAYFFSVSNPPSRVGIDNNVIHVATGAIIRDYVGIPNTLSLWPYGADFILKPPHEIGSIVKRLWPNRRVLQLRKRFSVPVEAIKDYVWYEYRELYSSRLRTQRSIAFAEIATNNHFVLDRGGKVFMQTAPVIKLSEAASEEDHLALLGVLNSSTACFWLKQVCHVKGGSGIGRGVQDEAWEDRFAFNSTRIEQFPLPAELPLEHGQKLDGLAQRLAAVEPSAVCAEEAPTRERLDAARVEHDHIRARMIALQEELDWDVYRRYGLLDKTEAQDLLAKPESVPELRLGERAFEIVLARRIEAGEVETQWFARHRSNPITEIPEHWPQDYRDVVAKRIETIGRRRDIGLIERPECKRRWQSEPWGVKEREALTTWLLDRCEEAPLWYGPDGQPRAMTVNRLADRLRADADVVSVARLLKGPDADLAEVLKEIIADEHVPYLAQLRYKGEGLLKRTLWERTWDLQREEDRTGQRLDIPVPPKYISADFIKNSYWRQRGKLDVPKERFLSYPYASPDSDSSMLLGCAVWDHREQAHALIALMEERSATDGWQADRLKPLLAGLAEVMPWVRQWHGQVDDRFGTSPADAYDTYLTFQREKYGLTDEDLQSSSPPQMARGRRRRS
jgi:hypothetical protein